MSKKKNIPENIENYILIKEIEYKELIRKEIDITKEFARKEIENVRKNSYQTIAFISLFISFVGAIGFWSFIKTETRNAVENKIGDEFYNKIKNTSEELFEMKNIAEKQLSYINKLDNKKWDNVSFNNNNWYNYGEEFSPLCYMKDAIGRVYLKGVVRFKSSNNPKDKIIFTLPEGYRPSHRELFIAKTYKTTTRIDIYPNGNVCLNGPFSYWLSLNINFNSIFVEKFIGFKESIEIDKTQTISH